MTGVMFLICVPSRKHEEYLKNKAKRIYVKSRKMTSSSSTIGSNFCSKSKVFKAKVKSPDRRSLIHNEEYCRDEDNQEPIFMQKLVEDILENYQIDKSTCIRNVDENYLQYIFTMESGSKSEDVLAILREHNIGHKYESLISVIPCGLYYHDIDNAESPEEIEEKIFEENENKGWNKFVLSVRARLKVAEVVEELKAEASITFDYICLVAIASIVCAIGLVDNSNVYLLSSMLISPLMGPVMAGTFGTVIRDRTLQKIGVQSELIGLGIATLVGFCYGSIICLITNKYGEVDWPSSEMINRGEIRTLAVGSLIALLAGAAVAVGVLSDNIASLVGVAISTSLMPPAVNAGLLWSMASVYYLKGNETSRYVELSYTEYYSTDTLTELTCLGGMSLCLTFANIICIYIAGIVLFKIKEVAPVSLKNQARRQFWKHDIKIARDYNKTLHKGDATTVFQRIEEDLNAYIKETKERYAFLHHSSDFPKTPLLKNKESQHTWCAYTGGQKAKCPEELQEVFDIVKEKETLLRKGSGVNHHYRRLSQIFAPDDSLRTSSSSLASSVLTEVQVQRERTFSGTSGREYKSNCKFVVTPCDVSNLSKT